MSGPYYKGLISLRSINWGRNYRYDAQFGDGSVPSPFQDWFPLTDVEVNEGTVVSTEYKFGQSTYRFPIHANAMDMRMTFNDDEDYTLLQWLKTWYNQIAGSGFVEGIRGGFVQTLAECARPLTLVRLGPDGEPATDPNTMLNVKLWIYPDQAFYWRGSSMPEIPTYPANFQVVGVQ